jgi:hypothetical protein
MWAPNNVKKRNPMLSRHGCSHYLLDNEICLLSCTHIWREIMKIKAKLLKRDTTQHYVLDIPLSDMAWGLQTPEQKAAVAFLATANTQNSLNPGDLLYDDSNECTILLKNKGIKLLDVSAYNEYMVDIDLGIHEKWL